MTEINPELCNRAIAFAERYQAIGSDAWAIATTTAMGIGAGICLLKGDFREGLEPYFERHRATIAVCATGLITGVSAMLFDAVRPQPNLPKP